MLSCDQCVNPAQWIVVETTPISEAEREADRKRKLVPRGIVLNRVGQLCSQHKELRKLESNQRFRFVGTIPPGLK